MIGGSTVAGSLPASMLVSQRGGLLGGWGPGDCILRVVLQRLGALASDCAGADDGADAQPTSASINRAGITTDETNWRVDGICMRNRGPTVRYESPYNTTDRADPLHAQPLTDSGRNARP